MLRRTYSVIRGIAFTFWAVLVAQVSPARSQEAGPPVNVASSTEPSTRPVPITALAIHPTENRIVTGSQQGLALLDGHSLVKVARWETSLAHVHDTRFSPDGTRLLIAGGAPGERGGVELREWPSGRVVWQWNGHADVVYRVAWSPAGSHCATASGDGTCCLVAVDRGVSVATYQGHSRPVLAVTFVSNSNELISGGADHTLRLWSTETGQTLRTLDNHVATVNEVAIRPRDEPGPLFASSIGEDRTVRLWQPMIGRLVRFARLPSVPRAHAWSRRGDQLFVACNDGRIRSLDPETMEVTHTWASSLERPWELTEDALRNRLLVAGVGGIDVIEVSDK